MQADIDPLGMISPGLYSFRVSPYITGDLVIAATVAGYDLKLIADQVTVINSGDGEVDPGDLDHVPNQGLSALRPDRSQLDLQYGAEFGLTLHLLNASGNELGGLSSKITLLDDMGRVPKVEMLFLGETSTGVYSWIISPKVPEDLSFVASIPEFSFTTRTATVSVIDTTIEEPEKPVDPDPQPKPKYYTSVLTSELVAKQENGLNEIRIFADVTVNTEGENDYKDYIGNNITIVDNLGNELPGKLEFVSSLVGRYEFMYYPSMSGHLFIRTMVEGFVTDGTITLTLGEFNTGGGVDPGIPESKYPLDEYGINPKNHIKGEVHTVSSLAFKDYFLLIPEASPFYVKDLKVEYRAPNSTDIIELQLDVDYTLALEYVGASRALRRPVYGGIVFQNLNLSGLIIISYRTVGGEQITDNNAVINKLIEQVWNPKIVYWEYVSNSPNLYPPEPHPHEFDDFSGAKEIVDAIHKVSSGISIEGELNRDVIADFLAKFNISLFDQLMKGFINHPYQKLISDIQELKLQFNNIEKLGLTSGGTFGLQFGVIYPTMNPKPNEGCLFLNGDKFDPVRYPKLGKLFPDGILPNATDRYLIGAGGEFSLMELVNQRVLKHTHTNKMDNAGIHTHTTTVSENGKHNHAVTIVSAGKHQHSVSLTHEGEHSHSVTAAGAGKHSHVVSIKGAGGHNHSVTIADAGAHSHVGTASSGGAHTHTRGTMNITGNTNFATDRNDTTSVGPVLDRTSGAYTAHGGVPSVYITDFDGWGGSGPNRPSQRQNYLGFDASRAWTGNTSSAGSHTHTVSVGNAGTHKHTATINTVADHVHATTVDTNPDHTHVMTVSSVDAHTHKATMTDNGEHVHKAEVVGADNHKHTVTNADAGTHTHKLTINNTGDDKQLVDAIAVNYMILAA